MDKAERTSMTEEEIAFSEIIGDLVEQWGFRRHLGRIWSLLYLRAEPVNPTRIQSQLELSAGSVNAHLSELQTWGTVKRVRIAGDRNFYYEVNPSIWKSVSNVIRTRELRILEEAQSGLRSLSARLKRGGKDDFQARRVEKVRTVAELAIGLSSLLIGAPPEKIVKAVRMLKRLRSL